MQAEEAGERRVVDRRPAEQPGLDRIADHRDRAEQAGDDGGAPERHLPPGQHIAHERGAHHQDVDQHADDPGHLARRLVRAVVEAAEDVQIDREEEQRRAVGMHVAQRPAAVHVAHDVLDRAKAPRDAGVVVHHQDDAGHDLHHQAEEEHDAPDPHPVQVLGRGDHQGGVEQAQDRQPALDPLLGLGLRLVVVVGNAAHGSSPSPSSMTVSDAKDAKGIGRFSGAGPLRMRPAVS